MNTALAPEPTVTHDFLPIDGMDYVELYVGNAKQAAHYYQSAFGFQPLAYAGPETGLRDRASYVLAQGKIRLMLTSTLLPTGVIAEHIAQHGDGVRVVAFTVPDAIDAFLQTTARGAQPYFEPKEVSDKGGTIVRSGIHTYGDTVHVFVQRKGYEGVFLPGFQKWEPVYRSEPTGLVALDHLVGNVELGKMNYWVDFYEKVMGFHQLTSFDDKDISTEYTALMSKVMASGHDRIKMPINEPAAGKKKSQIEEYLDFYYGPGVQHIALLTGDILKTVADLRSRGVEFLRVPDSYYEDLQTRVGAINEDIEQVKALNILVDRDDEGYLLQLFTRPLQDRPTLFIEIIQRRGARSFGKGNFKALFEAIEREQELRGNL
jgi:4-hydroxyphenylpyruvate dioxygenase